MLLCRAWGSAFKMSKAGEQLAPLSFCFWVGRIDWRYSFAFVVDIRNPCKEMNMEFDLPPRAADKQLYADIFNRICKHANGNDKILKAARFKYNADGSVCKGMTFEWHFKKLPKPKKK